MAMGKRCSNCIYSRDINHFMPGHREAYRREQLVCIRYPPTIFGENMGPPSTRFPEIKPYDLCGEFVQVLENRGNDVD